MMSAMFLPFSFFMFIRRVISQVVLEKENGMLEYLKMNSMSELTTRYVASSRLTLC